MMVFRVSISALLVVGLLAGCGENDGEPEAIEQARVFHETRDLMDVVIAQTLFSAPEERDRLIQMEADNGHDTSGARTDVDAFMGLREVGNRINEIRVDLKGYRRYMPAIDPQYR